MGFQRGNYELGRPFAQINFMKAFVALQQSLKNLAHELRPNFFTQRQ